MRLTTLSSVFPNLSRNLGNELLSKGSTLLGALYLARILGPDSFGMVVLSQTTVMLVWLFIDMGMSVYFMREVAQHSRQAAEIFNETALFRVMFGVLALAGYVIAVMHLVGGGLLRHVLIVNGLLLVCYPLCADWVLKGLERFDSLLLGGITFSVSYIAGLAIFVKDETDVLVAVWVWGAAHALLAIVTLFSLRSVGIEFQPRLEWGAWARHVRKSATFALSGWTSVAYHSLPIILISHLFSSQILGLFSAPYRLMSALSAPAYYVGVVYYPRLARSYLQHWPDYRAVSRELCWVLSGAGALLAAGLILLSEQICTTVLGAMYSDSVGVLRIMAFAMPLVYLRYGFGASLSCSAQQRYQALPYLLGLVCLTAILSGLAYTVESSQRQVLGLLTGGIVLGEVAVLTTYVLLVSKSRQFIAVSEHPTN